MICNIYAFNQHTLTYANIKIRNEITPILSTTFPTNELEVNSSRGPNDNDTIIPKAAAEQYIIYLIFPYAFSWLSLLLNKIYEAKIQDI